ncbi:MAG: DUF805 domain-containing protein [Chloroflexi bacterium]|nr:DUF805 domain-containing protein [Chloroflexota bacterium]
MTFTQAIPSGFRRYFDFKTRSSRSEYWWWTLFSILVSVAASIVDALLFGGTAILDTVSTVCLFIPGIAVAARRLHDINRTGWWILIAFTIIGIFLLFYWYLQPGDRGANDYGNDPLRPPAEAGFEGTAGLYRSPDEFGFCATCGTALEEDANFCRSCGAAV